MKNILISLMLYITVIHSANGMIDRKLIDPRVYARNTNVDAVCEYLKKFRGQIVAFEDPYWEWDECFDCKTGCPIYSEEETKWINLKEALKKDGNPYSAIRVDTTGCQYILKGNSLKPILNVYCLRNLHTKIKGYRSMVVMVTQQIPNL